MSASADALSSIEVVQVALQVVQTLDLTSWRFPPACAPNNGSFHDFIIVGAGTAGSVLGNRLSADCGCSVLLLEAGGPSPVEANEAAMFPYLADSVYDYNFTSVPDNYSAQNLQGGRVGLTQGKMLGGCSALNHLIHVHGHPVDFDTWAVMLNDSTWQYENVLPYFKKAEKLVDPGLLASSVADKYGTNGPIEITREPNPKNMPILNAYKELGHSISDDADVTLGYNEPLLTNAHDLRQSSSVTYLTEAQSRPNLCVATHTTVDKILIKGGKAVGVLVTDSNGDIQVYFAKKEVIVSAGTFNSPKLLMLSGIGPKDHLESHGIDVFADLPVGNNFLDHIAAVVLYQLENDTSPIPNANPGKFPLPLTTGYVSLNPEQSYPDYQVFSLVIPHDSAGFLQLCSKTFKFTNSFCDRLYNATVGRTTLLACVSLLMPKSSGKVLLPSADPKDAPLVYTNTYSNTADLEMMAASLKDYNKVLNTTYFRSVNANLVDSGLCKDATTEHEFWKCYALGATSLLHYVGTNAMGSVLDSKLRVKGVKRLRVIDSSSMPTITRANNNAAVLMLAERGADFILEEWGTCE